MAKQKLSTGLFLSAFLVYHSISFAQTINFWPLEDEPTHVLMNRIANVFSETTRFPTALELHQGIDIETGGHPNPVIAITNARGCVYDSRIPVLREVIFVLDPTGGTFSSRADCNPKGTTSKIGQGILFLRYAGIDVEPGLFTTTDRYELITVRTIIGRAHRVNYSPLSRQKTGWFKVHRNLR